MTSTSSRIAKYLSIAILLTFIQGSFQNSAVASPPPLQPTPTVDLANGDTTGQYTAGQVERTTTYLDSTTVTISERGVTASNPGFMTTYVEDNWSTPNATYPIGSTFMGSNMWGNGGYNGSFYTSPGFSYQSVEGSTGALFAYNAFKGADLLDTATGTIVAPQISSNPLAAASVNNRDHGLCTGHLPVAVGELVDCPNLGRVTFTFSRPVTNAILNIADLGGYGYYDSTNGNSATRSQVAVAGKLKVNTGLSAGVTGYRALTSNSTLKIDTSTATIYNPIIGNTWPNWAQPFGYGSIMFTGTYSSVTIDIDLSVYWAIQYQSTPLATPGIYATDYFGMSWSLQSLAISPHEYWMGTTNTLTTGNSGTNAVKVKNATFAAATNPAHGTVSSFSSSTGTYTYTPAPGFTGTDTFLVNLCAPAPAADYCVQAMETINVTAPSATHETKTAAVNTPITFTLLAGSGTTLGHAGSFGNLVLSGAGAPCFIDPMSSNCVTTAITVTEGVYSIDTATNLATFTPNNNFIGTATSLGYRVTDNYGDTATATLTPIYTATPPPAPPATPTPATVVLFPPIAYPVVITVSNPVLAVMPIKTTIGSAAIDQARTVILDPISLNEVLIATIAGQGTYTVDRTAAAINFQALPAFSGTATPITYIVFDGNGNSSRSTATPTIVAAAPVVPDTSTATTEVTVIIEKPVLVQPVTPTKEENGVVAVTSAKSQKVWSIKRTCKFHQITVHLKSQIMELCDPKSGTAYAMNVCTGKDISPTYKGWFAPQSFAPGYINGKGGEKMYYSVFFFKRIAIHGSPNVLDHTCSHGCVRIPMEMAKRVYAFAKEPHTQIFVKS